MATDDKADDLDEPSSPAKKDKSGMIKILLIVIGAMVFLGVNAGITFMLTSSNQGAQPAQDQTSSESSGETDSETKTEGADKGAAIYFKFDPAFIVNFQAGEELRFLQVAVEVMSRDPLVIAAVEEHMPVLRNNLIVLFSSQDFTTISTRVGKERIRAQVLSEIQKILREKIGKPGVDEVYFTTFVMQ